MHNVIDAGLAFAVLLAAASIAIWAKSPDFTKKAQAT
jgi:hypothetical protein